VAHQVGNEGSTHPSPAVRRRLTQSRAAAILGIDQPKVSALKQGKLSGFSIERLMRLLLVLGRDIEITVKERAKSRSVARLRVA
jgi:transcriptional regulator with XRE-family HTH domain